VPINFLLTPFLIGVVGKLKILGLALFFNINFPGASTNSDDLK